MLSNFRGLSKVLIVVLSLCLVFPALSLSSLRIVEAEEKPSSISLSSGVNVTLYDAQIVKDETGNLAAFTLLFQNDSNNTVNLIDYWARIKGSGNKSFVTKLISEDKEKKYVIPKTATYMTFYAYVDEKAQLQDLKLDLIKWDFSASDYERVIGSIKSNYDGFTAYKQAKEINLNKALMNVLLSGYKMYTDNQYAYVSFDLAIRNKSNSSVDLSKLQFYLSNGKGTLIELETSPKEIALKAQERKSMILTAAIPKSFTGEKVSVIVMHKDEEVSLNIPKGSLSLPKLTNTTVSKANTTTNYTVDGTTIALTMKESALSYTNKKSNIETKLVLENKSNNKIKLPNFEFYIKTAQGYLYPLIVTGEEEISLLPKIEQELTLQGEVPQDIKLGTSEIVIFMNSDGDNKQRNFLGSYKISIGNTNQPEQTTSSSATYQDMLVEQVSLQRTPNGVNDLLIAEFKITNKGNKGKGKLDLSGQFEIDGVKLSTESTNIIDLDRLVAVSPGQTYRVIAYTEIPYVQNAEKIVFSMKEKAEAGLKDIHSFEVSSMSNAKLLASNQNYSIDTLGGRGDVTVIDSSIYSGKQSDLFVAQLKYTNKEKRASVPTEITGYIENSKQDIIDLDVKKYEAKLLPDGESIIFVSAVIPKNYEDKKINLYFGEALKAGEELEKVIINPVYTQHLYKAETPGSSFIDMIFNQYQISLYNIHAGLDISDGFNIDSVKLDFNYDVKVLDEAPAFSDGQKIIVEFSDTEVPSVVFSKTFAINEGEEDVLQIGTRKSQSITFTSDLIQVKNFGLYNLNIYTEYKGYKKLIATKELEFGTVN